MRPLRTLTPICLIILTLTAACDEKPKPPAATTTAPVKVSKRPTTQELLSGPRMQLMLGTFPLSVQVTEGWKIETIQNIGTVLLKGPTPSGEASIQLSKRPMTKADLLEPIINGTKKEVAEKNDPRNKVDVRTLSVAKVVERLIVRAPAILTELDSKGQQHNRNVSEVSWTIQVFVPNQSNFDTYELNFVGLTLDQYEIDKPVLSAIIESLAYEAGKS